MVVRDNVTRINRARMVKTVNRVNKDNPDKTVNLDNKANVEVRAVVMVTTAKKAKVKVKARKVKKVKARVRVRNHMMSEVKETLKVKAAHLGRRRPNRAARAKVKDNRNSAHRVPALGRAFPIP